MSPKFPAVTSDDVIRVITRIGFRFKRQAGTSHAIYFRESDKRRTTIPEHPGKTIKRKTLKSILSDIGLTVEEFSELLHK
ncbi:MAG TPA: type II toxin-antitoxin system HicA family toxin [Dissulfurispiraceae bacterium]|nr:type II toxin-antitoxin system HicA family toxin [Dissulfurispiraceae bacterium]